MTTAVNAALMQAQVGVVDVDKLDKLKRYWYEPGCVRWLLIQDKANPAKHRAPSGWKVDILELEWHPIHFHRLQSPQTWVRETFIGDTE